VLLTRRLQRTRRASRKGWNCRRVVADAQHGLGRDSPRIRYTSSLRTRRRRWTRTL